MSKSDTEKAARIYAVAQHVMMCSGIAAAVLREAERTMRSLGQDAFALLKETNNDAASVVGNDIYAVWAALQAATAAVTSAEQFAVVTFSMDEMQENHNAMYEEMLHSARDVVLTAIEKTQSNSLQDDEGEFGIALTSPGNNEKN